MADHIEFKPTFLGNVPSAKDTWLLSATCAGEHGLAIRNLTPEDLVRVFALPELQRGSEPWLTVVGELCERVTKLQGLAPDADLGDWSPVMELFHPDMNISDIKTAMEALLKVAAAAKDHMRRTGHVSGDDELRRAIGVAYTALWEGRKTQLEKDQTGDQSLDQEDPLAQLRNALGHTGELPELITEVKRLVRIEGERVRIATHLEFTNAHVIADALRLPKLVDALSHVATFENERAVRQALRNLDPEKRGAQHNDRALWDTMFTHSFEQVLEKWHMRDEPALGSALEVAVRRGATAEALWQLLDDIDTLSDILKPDNLRGYSRFYTEALDITTRRHLLLKSDGHKLAWPSGDAVERGGHPRARVFPAQLVRTESDASWWKDRYEDLKRGVRNRLAGEHVQPSFEENAVLLAQLPVADEKYRDLVDTIGNLMQGHAFEPKFHEHQRHAKVLRSTFDAAHAALRPVPMLLHCPMCHARHIDEGEFATKLHHTHACQGYVLVDGQRRRCGHVWRPAIVATVGVEALPGFVNP